MTVGIHWKQKWVIVQSLLYTIIQSYLIHWHYTNEPQFVGVMSICKLSAKLKVAFKDMLTLASLLV